MVIGFRLLWPIQRTYVAASAALTSVGTQTNPKLATCLRGHVEDSAKVRERHRRSAGLGGLRDATGLSAVGRAQRDFDRRGETSVGSSSRSLQQRASNQD